MVEPYSFLVVELGTRLRASRDIKRLNKLVERKDFLLSAGVPTQERQEIDDGLGEIATFTIATAHLARLGVVPFQWEHGKSQPVAVALREFSLALGLQQQGQMGKFGHRIAPAESLVEQHMKRCRGQPLLATDDVRYLHQMVVNNVCQMISGQLVSTLVKHLVIDDVALHAHLATNHVVDKHLAARLHLETHHILLPVVNQTLHFLGRHGQRVAHAQACLGIVLEVLYLCTFLLQFLGSVEGDICATGIEQLLHILLVDVTALALAIRAILAAKRDALIELESQPAERLDDVFLGTWHESARVGILDAEHKFALVLMGKQIVEQCCAHSSDMQCPSGTWCETHPNFSFHEWFFLNFCAKLRLFFQFCIFFSYFRILNK